MRGDALKKEITVMGFKPEGYNSVSPYLIVDGAQETILFLKQVFDAVELQSHVRESGGIMHAEVQIDDSVIMLADAVEDWPAIPAMVHVYVKDVDATYRRALDAGATSVQEPQKKEDPDRRAGVKDSMGTTWFMATRVGS